MTLSHSPVVVLGTNSIPPSKVVGIPKGGVTDCQGGETVPQGTTAIRLWITGNVKPAVRVRVLGGGQAVTSGSVAGGWLGKVTTVPVTPVASTIPEAQVCFTIDRTVEVVDLIGASIAHPGVGEYPDRVRIEYLRPGPGSWWSLAGSIARRLGLGRAPAGSRAFLIPLTAMALATLIASWTILVQLGWRRREIAPIAGAQGSPSTWVPSPPSAAAGTGPVSGPRKLAARELLRRMPVPALVRRVPGPAWACAYVACLSAVSWSILNPPFEVIDEPSHFAYVQVLAETGHLPKYHSTIYSREEQTAQRDLDEGGVRFNPVFGTISTEARQRRLQRDLARPLSRVGRGAAVASSQPPLYYALQAIPYELASSGTLLDRLALMRLLSAVMAAATALFAYLFLREALPATPWAWTVGGLCTALAPLLGFISGAINPDAQLAAVSAALFYLIARAFRHSLTPRLALAIGAATAIGFLTKLNFIGLTPGILLALALLTRRATRNSKRTAYTSLAIALAIGFAPALTYALINILTHHPTLGLLSRGVTDTKHHHGSLGAEIEYIWESYLPRLPGMREYFPGISTIRQLWFDRLVGAYGWLDTHFPPWVYRFALVPAGLIAALAARELVRARHALRRRAGELLAYAAIAAGLLVLIGSSSYLEYPDRAGAYSEPRYLLPLAVLFAAVFALAARGAGRRWGPAVGTLLVLLILAHDLFSQLLLVGRYYA